MAELADRIEALRRQHHVMRTRTAHVEALPETFRDGAQIEEFFDRWDHALVRAEGFVDLGDGDYGVLRSQQDEEDLRRELRELRATTQEERQPHEPRD